MPDLVRIPRLESIRSKILVFAVVATLLPSGITLWVSYVQNRRALEAKIAQELLAQSAQTSRELSVWLKERLYDLRVFATSDVVSGHLERATTGPASSPARGRLYEYLGSLHERFTDFDQLLVLDLGGRVVASSTAADALPRLGQEWQRTLRVESQLISDAVWDDKAGKGRLMVAVPVQRLDNTRLTGAFAAELNFKQIQHVLRAFAADSTSALAYLVDRDGKVVVSSRENSSRLMKSRLKRSTLQRLIQREGTAVDYASFTGGDVVGTLKRVPQAPWSVVVEMPAAAAYEQVNRFRNFGMLVMAAILIVTATAAYQLGRIIVRPLERLQEGAKRVMGGDLGVDLPVVGGDEVAFLTKVFNGMVWRLRQDQEELTKLSRTDALTGLANRRSLMERLNEETLRFRRTRKGFAVLMADVDHFKEYNDSFGHPAGDEVLKKVAQILQTTAREIDCVARYGGEEFCVMLPETTLDGAGTLAERICEHVAATEFAGRKVTVSIGVASLPGNGDTSESVIAAADAALYQAKREGRNRVVLAETRRARKETSRDRGAKKKA